MYKGTITEGKGYNDWRSWTRLSEVLQVDGCFQPHGWWNGKNGYDAIRYTWRLFLASGSMAHIGQCAKHLLKELVKHLQSYAWLWSCCHHPRLQNPLIFASKLFVGQKMWLLTIQLKDASTWRHNTATVFDPGPETLPTMSQIWDLLRLAINWSRLPEPLPFLDRTEWKSYNSEWSALPVRGMLKRNLLLTHIAFLWM